MIAQRKKNPIPLFSLPFHLLLTFSQPRFELFLKVFMHYFLLLLCPHADDFISRFENIIVRKKAAPRTASRPVINAR